MTKMLALAEPKRDDQLIDLGSGDGRILINAAKNYGCHCTGWEIDQELAAKSRENAKAAGLLEQVSIENKDFFTADLSRANVVTLYLIPQTLKRLKDQLLKLPAGARVVSHHFAIPHVKAEKVEEIESAHDGILHRMYLYRAPLEYETGPSVP